ncbi:MAG: site-specific integrase [Desulfobacteraceae bacterium]|nr:site-specific integrase [Desulfobacteraceae bacterium]
MLSLTWDKVDLKNDVIQLEASDTKDKEPRKVPISKELIQYLLDLPKGLHNNHVFLYQGKPIKDIRTGLINACKKAGVLYGQKVKEGFIFHDLRHTFNTNMRKAGVSESVIMEITGHSTRQMFDRYNTVDNDDIKQAVEKMGGYLADVTLLLPQDQKKGS